MAAGDYEAALPIALEAVALGEKLFKPQPALQLFPLYLLAAQVWVLQSLLTLSPCSQPPGSTAGPQGMIRQCWTTATESL